MVFRGFSPVAIGIIIGDSGARTPTISHDFGIDQKQITYHMSIPTLLKIEFEGGSRTEISFIIPCLQSCFLNDQYSSSFHVIGVGIYELHNAPYSHPN